MKIRARRHDAGHGHRQNQSESPGRSDNLKAQKLLDRFERQDRLSARESRVSTRVLQLDVTGVPQAWITAEVAAGHLATGSVAWYAGDGPLVTLHGGFNVHTGIESTLDIPSIMALRGQSRLNLHDCVPVLTNTKLFKRDRMTCVYCTRVFAHTELTREHILPTSRQGSDEWMNVATACRVCNSLKNNKLLCELGWKLAYTPYIPSLYEDLLLRGRSIRTDVHEWLAAKLPKGSRLS